MNLQKIIIDNREKTPYFFPKHITVTKQLKTGDYSISGFESKIAIERKTHTDIWQTIAQRRKAFKREFERLAEMEKAVIIIECNYNQLLTPPERCGLSVDAFMGTLKGWRGYYNIPIELVGNRVKGEQKTTEILNNFARKNDIILTLK